MSAAWVVAPAIDWWGRWPPSQTATSLDLDARHPQPSSAPAAGARAQPGADHPLPPDQKWRHDIVRIRTEVMSEIHDLVDEFQEPTAQWMSDRPPAVRQTSCTPDKDRPTEVPLLLHRFLTSRASPRPPQGVRHAGGAIFGTGCVNWRCVRLRTSSEGPGEHSPMVEEAKLGRVIGPCRPPGRHEHLHYPTFGAWTGCRITPGDVFAPILKPSRWLRSTPTWKS